MEELKEAEELVSRTPYIPICTQPYYTRSHSECCIALQNALHCIVLSVHRTGRSSSLVPPVPFPPSASPLSVCAVSWPR